MKTTGVIRKLDELGRITLPIELRRSLDLDVKDGLEITVQDDCIILKKAECADIFTGSTDDLLEYEGKKVSFLALVYNPEKLKKGVFVPGRFAMTCCIEDVTFIGFKCKYDREEELPHKSWITITAEIRVEFAREYKGKGPVLYPVSIEKAQKPEDELVYFS